MQRAYKSPKSWSFLVCGVLVLLEYKAWHKEHSSKHFTVKELMCVTCKMHLFHSLSMDMFYVSALDLAYYQKTLVDTTWPGGNVMFVMLHKSL